MLSASLDFRWTLTYAGLEPAEVVRDLHCSLRLCEIGGHIWTDATDGLHLCPLFIRWVAEFIIEREVTSVGKVVVSVSSSVLNQDKQAFQD